MIDTHCHLFRSYYEDLDNLIVKLKENNIYCIVNGCEYFSNIESVELSNNDNIYAAVGYQPTELDNIEDDYIEILEGMLDNNKVVAIGEIGLDYYWNKDNRNIQIEVFKKQLELASKYNLPVIIHSRDAVGDVYNILKEYNVRGVIHAFSGSYESAMEFIKIGFKLGIGGVITFKNCKLKEVISKLKLEDIVLETDSPYLTPVPNRGKRNSPLNLIYIAEYISKLKCVSVEEVISTTNKVACELFDLDTIYMSR